MPYQYVREPLTDQESDRLSNACETTSERLVVWNLQSSSSVRKGFSRYLAEASPSHSRIVRDFPWITRQPGPLAALDRQNCGRTPKEYHFHGERVPLSL